LLQADPALRSRAVFEAIADGLARDSLEAAASFAMNMPPRPEMVRYSTKRHERLLRDFARSDPEHALVWAKNQSTERLRGDSLSVVLDQLAITRPEMVGTAIESMPASRTKERVFVEHAERLARNGPEAARAWALTAEGSEQRNLALSLAAVSVAPRDPAAALDLVRAMDFAARPASMRFGRFPDDGNFDIQESNTQQLRHTFAVVAERAPRETWEVVQQMEPPVQPGWQSIPNGPMDRLHYDMYGWQRVRREVFEAWLSADRMDFSAWLGSKPLQGTVR